MKNMHNYNGHNFQTQNTKKVSAHIVLRYFLCNNYTKKLKKSGKASETKETAILDRGGREWWRNLKWTFSP